MVYVDDFKAPDGMKYMYHLIADTPQELREIARNMALPYNCIRNAGKYNEHLYISAVKRNIAISQGAKKITSQELVAILKARPDHPDNKWAEFIKKVKTHLNNTTV